MRHCSSSGSLNYMRQGCLEQKKKKKNTFLFSALLKSLLLTCCRAFVVVGNSRMDAARGPVLQTCLLAAAPAWCLPSKLLWPRPPQPEPWGELWLQRQLSTAWHSSAQLGAAQHSSA